jgi:glucosamine--fructose-6-phosphate aminotransferase (isomerizing)
MCGIVGYIGKQQALPILMEGLRRLEYRGYDSAGVTLMEKNKILTVKSVGKIYNLENKLNSKKEFAATLGIAHTRWATHGKPCRKNCHPHSDCQNNIFLVHNGIIENYRELKHYLSKKGHRFNSETDSEVIVHLIEEFNKKRSFKDSVMETLRMLRGTYGLVIIDQKEPDKIIAARLGSPLILGLGNDEYIIASDASAIVRYTNEVIYLEDKEVALIERGNYEIFTLRNKNVNKEITQLEWSIEKAERQGHSHFMLKEILEQPQVIEDALRGRLLVTEGQAKLGGLNDVREKLKKIDRIVIVSCGTSLYAGMVGKYMLEEYAGVPTEVEHASEYRYRKPIIDERSAVIAISQSGETADTLAAIREAKSKGALVLGIVNAVGSTISRETEAGVYNHAGPEIGVASTKAFTSQITILVLMTLLLGRQRSMSVVMGKRIASELKKIPLLMGKIVSEAGSIKRIARKYLKYNDFLCLGRKYNFPIALEGALKIKEISYVHAEGYPSGEMKHGPIAMVDKTFPTVFIVPKDSVYEKNLSGLQEIKARSGHIIAVATQGDKEIKKIANDVIYIPKTLEMLTPLLSVIPLQLLAYYLGIGKGFDVDKPRNLAKSVTVE